MRGLKTVVCVVLVVGPAWGWTVAGHAVEAPGVEIGAEGVTLPMGLRGGRPVVAARVNGKGPYPFYFDTGASGSVLSHKLARELKLEVIGRAGVKSGGDAADRKPIAAELVRVDRLEIGAARLSAVPVVAVDLTRLGGPDAPVGVLSPALLSGYLICLDYPKKEIRIRAGGLGRPDNKTVFAYQEGRTIPSVMATVGGLTVETHLDSGSGGGLSLPTGLAEKLPLEGKPKDTGKKARSVRGAFPVYEGKVKGTLSFGQFSFADPTVEFSDVVHSGNLGARILGRFILTLDVKGRRFQLTEGK
jgi:hypothetical protein